MNLSRCAMRRPVRSTRRSSALTWFPAGWLAVQKSRLRPGPRLRRARPLRWVSPSSPASSPSWQHLSARAVLPEAETSEDEGSYLAELDRAIGVLRRAVPVAEGLREEAS